MKKKIISIVFVLMFLFSIRTVYLHVNGKNTLYIENININSTITPLFDNVIFITSDGVRRHWMRVLTDDGTLVSVNRVLENGFFQKFRITNHKTGTDPGLACLETGYGDSINNIVSNQFGPGTAKDSITKGLTTAERLKDVFGDDIKIAYFLPWSFHQINEEHMNQVGNYTDTIFENIIPGKIADYWFAAENFSWTPDDEEAKLACLDPFNVDHQVFMTPLLKAGYLGNKAKDWILNNSNERFYIRMHLTEPDHVGHGSGESLASGNIHPTYLEAMRSYDYAANPILDALESTGILDETLVILGTDHGFYEYGHDGPSWPSGNNQVTEPLFAFSDTAVRHPENITADQSDISPTILASLGVNLSTVTPTYVGDFNTGIVMWERAEWDTGKTTFSFWIAAVVLLITSAIFVYKPKRKK